VQVTLADGTLVQETGILQLRSRPRRGVEWRRVKYAPYRSYAAEKDAPPRRLRMVSVGTRRVLRQDDRVPFRIRRRKSTAPEWVVGSRVVVRQDPDYGPGPWPAEPTGRIAPYPDGATHVHLQTRKARSAHGGSSSMNRSPRPMVTGLRESQLLDRYLSPPP
jgi:hypothetical protein